MSTSSLSNPESPLDVLSRAASMVERSSSPSSSDGPTPGPGGMDAETSSAVLNSSLKERHPKFRRNIMSDERMDTSDYTVSMPTAVNASTTTRVFNLSAPGLNNANHAQQEHTNVPPDDAPLDMSIKRQRSESPSPPQYKFKPLLSCHPLPGKETNVSIPPAYPPPPYPANVSSSFAHRSPPPSYESATSKNLHSASKANPNFAKPQRVAEEEVRNITIIGDCGADPLLDEHFRKSLGANYESLYQKSNSSTSVSQTVEESKTESPIDPVKAFQNDADMDGYTVEDHFAKALGDTWIKLQAKEEQMKKSHQNEQSREETSNTSDAMTNRLHSQNSPKSPQVIVS